MTWELMTCLPEVCTVPPTLFSMYHNYHQLSSIKGWASFTWRTSTSTMTPWLLFLVVRYCCRARGLVCLDQQLLSGDFVNVTALRRRAISDFDPCSSSIVFINTREPDAGTVGIAPPARFESLLFVCSRVCEKSRCVNHSRVIRARCNVSSTRLDRRT